MDTISVIVPIYMVEKYLSRCIESIINQTYSNLQIILVNDGSPDNCPKICEKYAKQDNRIMVVHKKNGGLSDARNSGITYATGKYLTFVDSDDYIAPTMIEELYKALKTANADMAICNFKYISDEMDVCCKNTDMILSDEILTGKEILCERMFQPHGGHWVVAWNKLYKREIFDDIRFPNGKIHEDEFVIHDILIQCDTVVCLQHALYFYTQRSSSIMAQKPSIKRLDIVEAYFNRAKGYLDINSYEQVALRTIRAGIVLYQTFYYQTKARNEKDYLIRNRELQAQYRGLMKRIFQSDIRVTVVQKCRLISNYISLYFTWKLSSCRVKLLYKKQSSE